MSAAVIGGHMRSLASYPGIRGCALVESDTGMVWYHAGELPGLESIAEAAIEFWRVHARHTARFAQFGPLQSAAFSFAEQVVALFPCTASGLVLVCVADKGSIGWTAWGDRVQELKRALALPDAVAARR